MRVCVFFNAQRHQILHGISTAAALSRRPGFEVHVRSPSDGHVAYARAVAGHLGPHDLRFGVMSSGLLSALRRAAGTAVPPKVVSLGLLARELNGFDAIAAPERTSILLRRLGVRRPLFIHLDHGAGDRAAGFDPRIRDFDFVLMAGEKHRERLSREGLIRPGRYAVVGYPKFDAADAVRNPDWQAFDNGRPTVLYNPHFSDLGSWTREGEGVLAAFAGQTRYNLLVAPHVRLLDGRLAQTRWRALAEAYAQCPHIRFADGCDDDRAIDMTYVSAVDVYLGDVSSQVYEFLRTPRPCVFLDAHGVDWDGDENYGHWRFGPVVRSAGQVIAAVDEAMADHGRWRPIQREGFAATFACDAVPASQRAADAIGAFLEAQAASPARRRPHRRPLARAAAALLAMAAGGVWLAREASEAKGDDETPGWASGR